MNEIAINRQPVELFKILKFEGLASSGAEAKIVIAQGLVKVNQQTELRKRKKISDGDIIEFDNKKYKIVLDEDEPS